VAKAGVRNTPLHRFGFLRFYRSTFGGFLRVFGLFRFYLLAFRVEAGIPRNSLSSAEGRGVEPR
jgi:uncharacterized membrane protein